MGKTYQIDIKCEERRPETYQGLYVVDPQSGKTIIYVNTGDYRCDKKVVFEVMRKHKDTSSLILSMAHHRFLEVIGEENDF